MTDLTMYEAVVKAAKERPNDLALYYQGTKITFKVLKTVPDPQQVLNKWF